MLSPQAKELIEIYLSKKFTNAEQIEGVDTTDFKSVLLGIKRYLIGNEHIFERARLLCSISLYNESADEELYEVLSNIITTSAHRNIGITRAN